MVLRLARKASLSSAGVHEQAGDAALDTTVYALGSYVQFLAEASQRWSALKADPGLIGSGFEETLWIETPTQGFHRTTTHDVDVDGVLVPARSRVLIQNASVTGLQLIVSRRKRRPGAGHRRRSRG